MSIDLQFTSKRPRHRQILDFIFIVATRFLMVVAIALAMSILVKLEIALWQVGDGDIPPEYYAIFAPSS